MSSPLRRVTAMVKSIWNLKIDNITFQMGNNWTISFIQVNFVDQKGV